MIPPVDPATGNLPAGVHEAAWNNIVARYGYTPHRLALLAGLKAVLDGLRQVGCNRTYLDGSFDRTTGQPKGIVAIDLGDLP